MGATHDLTILRSPLFRFYLATSLLFDIDRSQAHHWAHRLQPILETALGEKKALPERQINSVQAFIERFPGVERVVMDGTERPVKRPTDSQTQKLNYSEKKKHKY